MLRAAVKTAVFAAEQIYGAGKGAEKLDFVVEQLEEQGFTANRNEIEAAVGEFINSVGVAIVDPTRLGLEEKPPEEE